MAASPRASKRNPCVHCSNTCDMIVADKARHQLKQLVFPTFLNSCVLRNHVCKTFMFHSTLVLISTHVTLLVSQWGGIFVCPSQGRDAYLVCACRSPSPAAPPRWRYGTQFNGNGGTMSRLRIFCVPHRPEWRLSLLRRRTRSVRES